MSTKKVVIEPANNKKTKNGVDFDESLMKALDNDAHNDLIHLTTAKIKAMNRDILSELIWSSDEDLEKALALLKDYRYVENMNEIKNGNYVRWIDIRDAEEPAVLNRGGIVCDLKVADEGVYIVVKNYVRAYFTIRLDTNLLFQKLSNQERVILYALDHIQC
jgi:hypothetical protein